MPSPPSDDNSPISRSPSVSARESSTGQAPLSRTGKFFQGMFGKKDRRQQVASLPEKQPPTSKTPSIEQPPQELIQVVPEPTDWGDEEESNWDDDFMDEPPPPVPSSPPPPPPSFLAKPAPPLESEQLTPPSPPPVQEAPLESEQLTPAAAVETEPSPPPVPATAQQVAPPIDNPLISVNIPRPKNIKYKTKSPETVAAKAYTAESPAADSPPDKVEGVELHIKRPTTVKYKTKPLPQTSLIDRILAPGKELWQKVQNWGDIIPSQLTENPKKILGILAAVLLSIVTSWAVINFWPSSAVAPVAIGQPVVAPTTSPAETFVQAVKSQFSTLASQYPAGLITNLELDNEQQVAIVTLGSLWASLPANQQQQVAQSLWQQSRTYQMSKLEMRSDNGNLLARSPIVGQEMVILSNW